MTNSPQEVDVVSAVDKRQPVNARPTVTKTALTSQEDTKQH